ncbi:cytochrome P460 family protein [Sphingomonas sp. UYP23]
MVNIHARSAAAAAALFCGAVAIAGSRAPTIASPVYGVSIPAGYRLWQVAGVAHEADGLNDIRVILGNDIAMKGFRSGHRPFPDGAIIARVAWKLVPSARNDAIFGKPQSFIAGDPTNVQIVAKDNRKYAATGGWGYGQFENGNANPDAALIKTCFACHARLPAADDFIFTSYAR